MGAARNTAPKWVDPDLPWGDTDKGAEVKESVLMTVVDRFHNHEEMSPESMAKAITELQETMRSLDGRLAGAAADAADAAHATKGLGANMVQMGDAMSKRIRTLEDAAQAEAERAAEAARIEAELAAEKARAEAAAAPKPTSRGQILRVSLALAGVLVAVVASIALLGPQSAPTRGPAPSPVLYSPNAPATGN
jgi:hypothetical protein